MKRNRLSGKNPRYPSSLEDPTIKSHEEVKETRKVIPVIKENDPVVMGRPADEILVPGMIGIGDNLMLYPYLKYLTSKYRVVYFRTPWPQLFWDKPAGLCPIPRNTNHIPHQENTLKYDSWYTKSPDFAPEELRIRYSIVDLMVSSCWKGIERRMPFDPPEVLDYKLELREPWIEKAKMILWGLNIKGPFAIARSCTYRWDWNCPAKVPAPEAMQLAVDLAVKKMPVIELGNINDKEKFVTGNPYNNTIETLVDGEIPIEIVLALMKLSSLVISPPGFAHIASLCLNFPSVIVHGGYVGLDSFEDERIDSSMVTPLYPQPFCRCGNRWHSNCNRFIPYLEIKNTMDKVLSNAP